MRGLGKYSKRGSSFIVAGVAGSAIVPLLLFAASDAHKKNAVPIAIAMLVPLTFSRAARSYAICTNFVPAYWDVADKITTTEIRVVRDHANRRKRGMAEEGEKERLAQSDTVDVEMKMKN